MAIDLFSPGVSDTPALAAPHEGDPVRGAQVGSPLRPDPPAEHPAVDRPVGRRARGPGGRGLGGALRHRRDREVERQGHARSGSMARDAAGRVWVERKYKQRADTTAYAKDRPVDGRDPFQVLYNRIANDLVRARDKRKPQELAEVREVARLRFAASMAPDPYAAYLVTDKKGRAPRRAAARGRRPDDRPHHGHPRARPHVRGHPQRVLRGLLRAHGQALRRLARLQLHRAGRARLDQPGGHAQEDPRRHRRRWAGS